MEDDMNSHRGEAKK